ncbi:hypothetical protein [Pseudorhodobacter antarcticus]|uniref:hypothetical protein n=1 Tax=Pseudorhodobacter antarcticus TaxID=1077947 RepID=UPI0012E0FE4B|nr:hypothetical protein [Pseudorhodobacter antarcticus]
MAVAKDVSGFWDLQGAGLDKKRFDRGLWKAFCGPSALTTPHWPYNFFFRHQPFDPDLWSNCAESWKNLGRCGFHKESFQFGKKQSGVCGIGVTSRKVIWLFLEQLVL